MDEKLCLYLPELQKDLCAKSYYREANDYGIIYLYYYGTIEVTLVLESIPVTHDIFFRCFLTSAPFHILLPLINLLQNHRKTAAVFVDQGHKEWK